MSVNITLNGKFTKHCRSHPLLDDPQKVKKAEEQERRKLRLLQVRDESKKLAKKIRDEVNKEKKRELQKLQSIKEQEMECWRQHALNRKGEEYRSALFQMGTAHNAARLENAQKAERQTQQASYKDFKKQIAARKLNQGQVLFGQETSCPCHHIAQCVGKEFKCRCVQTDVSETMPKESHKRKRHTSFSSSDTECEDEGYKEQTTLPQSSFSLSTTCDTTTSSSLSEQNRATHASMFVPANSKCVIKTPAVCLNVEVGSEDSITISAPVEVKDKHAEYNRQFSSVIRVSPRKGRKRQENTNENHIIRKSTTTTQRSNVTAMPSEETLQQSPTKQKTAFQPVTAKEKRFTLISDLVKRQQQQEITSRIITHQNKSVPPMCPPVSHATSTTATPYVSPRKQVNETTIRPSVIRPLSPRKTSVAAPQVSPRKQIKERTVRSSIPRTLSPRKTSAVSKSSKTITESSQHATNFTVNSKINTAVQTAATSTSSSGRVQFFDYNSKTSKERDQTAANVSVQRQKDNTQPTAMEQAALENLREKERQLETLKKSQIMEERSQKALEREQIRRDCNELTDKLDALTREYPNQGPTNENQLHIFADKQLRKETKMNTAIEKLLNRPAIITCSEINKPTEREASHTEYDKANTVTRNEINLGSLNQHLTAADDISSDSCCSILLGYVDDQSRLVKQDLQNPNNVGNNQDENKQKRLRSLLKRLDELRNSLLQELKNESESKTKKHSKFSSNEESIRQLLDSIGEMSKEREQIVNNGKTKAAKEREKLLDKDILEKKLKELYDLRHQQDRQTSNKDLKTNINKENSDEQVSSYDKENVICTAAENPVEIIITVRGDSKRIRIPQKPKRKNASRKSPSKIATLIRSPQPKIGMNKRQTPRKKTQLTSLQEKESIKRQNSYDSNSTSYASLPSQLPTHINDMIDSIVKEKSTSNTSLVQMHENSPKVTSEETSDGPQIFKQPARINPLIAQYVQRLLNMPRNAVKKLGVSSSDIDTPSSSIINTPTNVHSSEALITNERLIDIQNFIEENRSFIKDLEESIRSKNNVSLENSIKMFDDIWSKRLKSHKIVTSKNSIKNQDAASKSQDKTQVKKSSLKSADNGKGSTTSVKKSAEDAKNQSEKNNNKYASDKMLKDSSKSLSSHYLSFEKESLKSLQGRNQPIDKVDKATDTRLSSDYKKTEQSELQNARHATLTENRAQRIAELTELINRVREEKQRILETSLSSASENDRQSTEFHDLPEGKSSTRSSQDNTQISSTSSEEATQNKQSYSTDTAQEVVKLSSADKNKQINASRDSGIAESRPITALENHIESEPISQTSSKSTMPQDIRKIMKPPPTLKRYSPKMPEDELAHELSTIFEVDTPATSRINTAVTQTADESENLFKNEPLQDPIKFPTFEQYIKQLNLDISQLDPEESIKLQQEFISFLECLQKSYSPKDTPKYKDFPSLNAYLEKLAEGGFVSDTLQETLAQLRLSNIPPHNFPSVREYIRRNAIKASLTDEQQLLDTESLENFTDDGTNPNTENETGSIDIEEEMKRRKILKNSFRYAEQKTKTISSKSKKDVAFYEEILATESGLEKLSSSSSTTEKLEFDIKRITQKLQGQKEKQHTQHIQFLSSTTNSANTSTLVNSALKAASAEESSNDNSGKAFNLCEFLTRELLKRANNSGSTTSSDESLHTYFLHSLIDSITPRTPGVNSKSDGQTLERQRTSTPVLPQSRQAYSTASKKANSTQLFSDESRLSSVRIQDRSVRFSNSDSANADHSSN